MFDREDRNIMKEKLAVAFLFFTVFEIFACSSSVKCNNDSDCPKDNKCINSKCYPNAFTPDPQVVDPSTGCSRDEECGNCKKCDDGICRPVDGCDAGVVLIDGSRDITSTDIADIEDSIDIVGDIEDVQEETFSDIEEDIIEAGIEDAEDITVLDAVTGEDVEDIGDVSICDTYLSLVVTSRYPAGSLPRGTTLTINGQGFDSECGTLSVGFTGDPNPAKINEINQNYIKVVVPAFAKDGDITVHSFGQEAKLTGSSGFKLIRRMVFSDFGSDTEPQNKFFSLTFPNFQNFKAGEFQAAGKYPYPILLDPYNLVLLVITADDLGNGYNISAYSFDEFLFIKSVSNIGDNVMITKARMDTGKNLIYLAGNNGKLYIHEMGTLNLVNTINVGSRLFGLSVDTDNNLIYLGGSENDTGVVKVLNRESYEVVQNCHFGDNNSLGMDVIHHPKLQKLFVVDYGYGNLYSLNLPDFSDCNINPPVSLGNNCGPMAMAIGKNGDRLYVVCNNSVAAPVDATATVKGFDISTMSEIVGSPLDTKLITSTASDNSKNQVNIVYDDLDGYLFVVSDADKRISVIVENTFGLLDNPLSPDNTMTLSASGNFGIAIEDW